MLVDGAILPPRAALEAVAAVVRSVPVPSLVEDATSTSGGRGLLGRRSRPRAEDPAVELPVMLEHVAPARMQLLVTEFGNLTAPQAHALADEITAVAVGWQKPVVRFAGGTALDFPGDWSVWARLDGDVDALSEIARGVTQCVERFGLFVDRRLFRPMLSVATVTPQTTGPYLQAVVDALEDFRGEEWTAELALTKETFVDGVAEWQQFRPIPIGG